MSDQQVGWQESNSRYVAAGLAWLRLLLEREAQRGPGSAILPVRALQPATPATPAQSQRQGFLRKPPAPPVVVSQPVSTPPLVGASPITDEQIAEKAKEMTDAEAQCDPQPALVILGKRLNLSRFELNVLFVCIAMELDTHIAALCAHAQDDPAKTYPTFALALAIFDDTSWDVVSPERPLRFWRLIDIHQPGAQPLTTSPLRADERIVNFVKGLNYLDDRLASLVTLLDGDQEDLPASQQAVVEGIVRYWKQASTISSSLPIIQLVGADAPSKQLVAYHAAGSLGLHLYRVPIEMLPPQAADLELLARLWQREGRLLPLALYIDAEEVDGTAPNEGQVLPLNRFLTRSDGVFFLGTREAWLRPGRANLAVDVDKPTPAEQQAAWAVALVGAAPNSPALLSSQFNLNLSTIHSIAQSEGQPTGDETSLPDRLWDACRASVRPRLDTLAQRLDPKATWDDLVLPDEETNMLHQVSDQVMQRNQVYEIWGFAHKMNRGLGINALFAGESGTGKTMAAEVIANALRLNLYRIDLSAVVSKYIGETEKNLRRLFDAAEDGGAILFFDEADALFGKRSEVKDSHDRYANIEINYLLQRMESYRGLAILATNMKSALDVAFMRRLRFIVTFPFPGLAERKQMWQKVFPAETPKDELDYDRLARLNLTGGGIHNVALNAAFRAAQEATDKRVTMPLILAAARTEFRKLERPINEAEFRWQAPVAAQGVKG
jgi:hypothetical protein